MKPQRTIIKAFGLDKDSGNKCKNAEPIKAPADKATRKSRIFSKTLGLIARLITPAKEIKLTINVERRIRIKVFILLCPFDVKNVGFHF